MKLLVPLFATAAVVALAAEPPVSGLGNLTASAILGWYAWHTATRTVPQLVADFRGELAAERSQNHADRDTFFRELAEERSQRQADNTALVLAIDDLTTAIGGWGKESGIRNQGSGINASRLEPDP